MRGVTTLPTRLYESAAAPAEGAEVLGLSLPGDMAPARATPPISMCCIALHIDCRCMARGRRCCLASDDNCKFSCKQGAASARGGRWLLRIQLSLSLKAVSEVPTQRPPGCGDRGPSAPAAQEYLRLGEEWASSHSEEARELAEERLRRLLRATCSCSTTALCRCTCADSAGAESVGAHMQDCRVEAMQRRSRLSGVLACAVSASAMHADISVYPCSTELVNLSGALQRGACPPRWDAGGMWRSWPLSAGPWPGLGGPSAPPA